MDKTVRSSMIYLKAEQSVKVNRKKVIIKDIATVYCADKNVTRAVENIKVFQVPDNVKNEKKYAFSIVYMIELIQEKYPDMEISNVGSSEFVICYVPPKPERKWLEYSKVIIVCFLVFFGSAFTIMTFNEDGSIREVFKLLYGLFESDTLQDKKILEISYTIGIPMGTIIFFNHFSRFKMDDDPTPIQIQMRIYEGEEITAIIENSSREQRLVEKEQDMKNKKK